MDPGIDAVRAFNRFYTRFAGALEGRFLGQDLSLAEARALYEIANREAPVAADIAGALGIDAGFLSRIVRRFTARGWIDRRPGADARRREIQLSDAGRAAFAALDRAQADRVAASLAPLGAGDRLWLQQALGTARGLLGGGSPGFTVRHHRPGDMGMICARQTVIYAESNGWGTAMEVLLGEVTSHFLKAFNPAREACWIAEVDGAMAGSIFLVQSDAGPQTGQLRLLYTEGWARGRGIGSALIDTCVAFARAAGYAEVMLWTHSVLLPARRLYAAAGFQLIATEIHEEFGKPEPGEIRTLKF